MIESLPAVFNRTIIKDDKEEPAPEIGFSLGFYEVKEILIK